MNENRKSGPLPEHPDALDRKILALLQGDGRVPNAEIARATGASVRTVRKRIERMIENGVAHMWEIPDVLAVDRKG
ncbi:MAG: winged helix-turn-helix transcriptional regulator [Thermoleophilia bacterium]